jgi:hypothetical protein
VEREKTDKILTHVQNQETGCKVIKILLESHSPEMAEMKKGTKAVGLKFEKANRRSDQ